MDRLLPAFMTASRSRLLPLAIVPVKPGLRSVAQILTGYFLEGTPYLSPRTLVLQERGKDRNRLGIPMHAQDPGDLGRGKLITAPGSPRELLPDGVDHWKIVGSVEDRGKIVGSELEQ